MINYPCTTFEAPEQVNNTVYTFNLPESEFYNPGP